MRYFMFVVNTLALIASIIAIVIFLVQAKFGIAWLCVIPFLYSLCNNIAIEEGEN